MKMKRFFSTRISMANILLLQAPNLTCLVLDIPAISVGQCLRIFANVRFRNLDHFATTTLPHQGLCVFLRNHNSLTSIKLGACRQLPCPIQSVASLPHLRSAMGGAKCIFPLVSFYTTRIFSELSTAKDGGQLQLFHQLELVQAVVYFFSVVFNPADVKFVGRIAATLPRVSTLRMLEFIDNQVRKVPNILCPFTNDFFRQMYKMYIRGTQKRGPGISGRAKI